MKKSEIVIIKIIVIIFILTIVTVISLLQIRKKIGDVTSGYKSDGAYYSKIIDTNEYKIVSAFVWYIGNVLSFCTLFFFVLSMLSSFYLAVRYFIPLSKKRRRSFNSE